MAQLIAIKTIMTTVRKKRTTIKPGEQFEGTAEDEKKLIANGAAVKFVEEVMEEDPEEGTEA